MSGSRLHFEYTHVTFFSVFLIGLILKTMAFVEVCYAELGEIETGNFLHVGFCRPFRYKFL